MLVLLIVLRYLSLFMAVVMTIYQGKIIGQGAKFIKKGGGTNQAGILFPRKTIKCVLVSYHLY